jgi:pimeloyl-ACP methyl ester carboxylesterase
MAWEEPGRAHLLSRLAVFSRLIPFDKRGTGLSDRHVSVTHLEERMDDTHAVMDAAGSERAVAGSGLRFEDRGRHALGGLPEEVHLYTALGSC